MVIEISTELFSERAMEISTELKRIFDGARKNQRGKLFAAFAAIGAHMVNHKDISELLRAVGLEELPADLAPFFNNGQLLDDAKAALRLLATVDNLEPNSWGLFMEFCREQYG